MIEAEPAAVGFVSAEAAGAGDTDSSGPAAAFCSAIHGNVH